jgi:hypothetical protein
MDSGIKKIPFVALDFDQSEFSNLPAGDSSDNFQRRRLCPKAVRYDHGQPSRPDGIKNLPTGRGAIAEWLFNQNTAQGRRLQNVKDDRFMGRRIGAHADDICRTLGQHFVVGGEDLEARKILFQAILNLGLQIGSRDQLEPGRAAQRSQTQTPSHATADN